MLYFCWRWSIGPTCKTTNLVLITLLDWSGEMLNVNIRSHEMGHVMTTQIFSALKNCAFRETSKKCSINSTSQVRFSWRKVTWEITCGAGVLVWLKSKSKKDKSFNQKFLRVKRRYRLMVRLKAIKCIEKLLCFLSFHINLESSNLCSPKPIGMMIDAFNLMIERSIEWGWSSLLLLLIWLSLF